MTLDAKGDVGLSEDMIFALKNLLGVEDHAKGSYIMTKEKKFIELNEIIREMRTRWLQRLVKQEESQLWCISKHLLSSIMGLQEVANRFYSTKEEELAKEAEEDAGLLYCLFFELNEIRDKGGK